MMVLEANRTHMERALSLAARGRGRTSPNPMVGAVLIREGAIIGEGYHAYAGSDHAEVVALRAAGGAARGAVCYVTLEPCAHYGKTPPCTEALIEAGIAKVVVAAYDPNPVVAGRGVRRLREVGVSLEVGLLQEEAVRLNEAYFKHIRTREPFVLLKAALSLDGKLATRTGDSQWIAGELARHCVHEMRNTVDAVAVGIGTVLRDDPMLTTRLGGEEDRDPLRVVVDSRGRLPLTARLLRSGSHPPLVAASPRISPARIRQLRERGVEVLVLPSGEGGVSLPDLIRELGRRDITSVMIEGGGKLATFALQAGIVDKLILMVAPILIGGKKAPTLLQGNGIEKLSEALHVKQLTVERLGDDLLLQGYLTESIAPWAP
ncbi:MAG: bifunctional diaminohydroxyphosphoribosylaminopyrimidine deaminase/5-amino-6-(5-phosphoribosylamino)uracil reductase RibD [candidate division NC10 bacterium]|nr:bifunctional diaminohydroxyphosphoribosylaminopyrimidine deaminase/5-amino-6-(5-phosphoribosylamino)uracil reductase RibD [candidate division NC10 bacterium]MCH7895516.1 bifunctional diaminohydroxyphosphoribosylaminopyrimidine deaminase/5-amino-6-(5-phosphoribosylamino)uracil reductase RibD [candidate division NC10 bacterium]MCZ6551866.1 bifunctional diaminohydroxyphosphoribosylaminopyrimidine deaminase/5-amino-6-(5-phosphoribosylamino)uracil reductase RibD [candidate division NC10 bacterium]